LLVPRFDKSEESWFCTRNVNIRIAINNYYYKLSSSGFRIKGINLLAIFFIKCRPDSNRCPRESGCWFNTNDLQTISPNQFWVFRIFFLLHISTLLASFFEPKMLFLELERALMF